MYLSLFCKDLDSFLTWLVQTQTAAASDQLPNDLEEAEKLINKHAALKEEIGRWVTEGCSDNLIFNTSGVQKRFEWVTVVFHAGTKRTTNACRPWTSCWSPRRLLSLRLPYSSGCRSSTSAGTNCWKCGRAGERFWSRLTFSICSCEMSNRLSPSSTTRWDKQRLSRWSQFGLYEIQLYYL